MLKKEKFQSREILYRLNMLDGLQLDPLELDDLGELFDQFLDHELHQNKKWKLRGEAMKR